jgi:hypothetical protein
LAAQILLVFVALGFSLLVFRLTCVHALSIRNMGEASVEVACGPFANFTVRSKETRDLRYSIIGRSFSCVVASPERASTCGRALRGLEDVYIAVSAEGGLDCEDY